MAWHILEEGGIYALLFDILATILRCVRDDGQLASCGRSYMYGSKNYCSHWRSGEFREWQGITTSLTGDAALGHSPTLTGVAMI